MGNYISAMTSFFFLLGEMDFQFLDTGAQIVVLQLDLITIASKQITDIRALVFFFFFLLVTTTKKSYTVKFNTLDLMY